jgi:hypothetical protein|tara:strand:- start:5095 stop:5247 length:153 start_codon:yes stop_codon:yes gene_type:complete
LHLRILALNILTRTFITEFDMVLINIAQIRLFDIYLNVGVLLATFLTRTR